MPAQTFPVAQLVNSAYKVLGVSPYVAAAALKLTEGELTIAEAQAAVAEFLGTQANDPTVVPDDAEVVVVSIADAEEGFVLVRGEEGWALVSPTDVAESVHPSVYVGQGEPDVASGEQYVWFETNAEGKVLSVKSGKAE